MYCITEVWLAKRKWLWISRVLGVSPLSRCSRWMKSRTLFCRGVSMNSASQVRTAMQVQMNINVILNEVNQSLRVFRIPVRIRRRRRQIVTFGLELRFDFLDRAIELLI